MSTANLGRTPYAGFKGRIVLHLELNGYITLHRKLLDWPYSKKSDYFSVWVHLLLMANWKDKTEGDIPSGKTNFVPVKRGQVMTSRKTLAQLCGCSESKIERILKCLEIGQQLKQQTHAGYRLITIIKYDEYQINAQVNGQQLDSNWTATGQQLNTPKEDIKNVKKEDNIPPIKKSPSKKQPSQFSGAPETMEVTSDMNAWAIANGITCNLKEQTEQMLDHHRKKGDRFKDWKAAWRTWMRNTKKFKTTEDTQPTGRLREHQAPWEDMPDAPIDVSGLVKKI